MDVCSRRDGWRYAWTMCRGATTRAASFVVHATVIRSAIANTMSSEEYMDEPVAPDDVLGAEGDGTPAPADAPQHAVAKSGAEVAVGRSEVQAPTRPAVEGFRSRIVSRRSTWPAC
jgi:hypothetical protein